MPSSLQSLSARVGAYFGTDDTWERPRPTVGRQDVLLAVTVAVVGWVSLELVRSVGVLEDVPYHWGVQSLAVLTGSALLVGRRRWPLAVAALAATHMLVVGLTMPVVMAQFTLQLVYFVAILSGVSSARCASSATNPTTATAGPRSRASTTCRCWQRSARHPAWSRVRCRRVQPRC